MPLKLIPPYGHVDAGEHHGIHTDSCDVAEGERVYIGLKGSNRCADYEVNVEWFEGECHEMPFDDSSLVATAEAASGAKELQPHHFEYGSCTSNSYQDYRLTISEELSRHTNLEIQLEDLSQSLDTSALALYLYHGGITEDRRTEHYSDFTHDGTYAVAVSQNDLQPGVYYIAIRCGTNPVSYRIMVHEIEATLLPVSTQAICLCV